jgi:predicted nucleic acid-binding protein
MNALLDSSFLIDLLNELAERKAGPASDWLRRNPRARLWISTVSAAEVLEGADDVEQVSRFLSRFRWQGLHRSHAACRAFAAPVCEEDG